MGSLSLHGEYNLLFCDNWAVLVGESHALFLLDKLHEDTLPTTRFEHKKVVKCPYEETPSFYLAVF
jgi:hypothetical protein